MRPTASNVVESRVLAGFDYAEDRTWCHLDTCQFETHVQANIPRVQDPRHGVKQVRVPWAEPRSGFTLLAERVIIDLIRQLHEFRRIQTGPIGSLRATFNVGHRLS